MEQRSYAILFLSQDGRKVGTIEEHSDGSFNSVTTFKNRDAAERYALQSPFLRAVKHMIVELDWAVPGGKS